MIEHLKTSKAAIWTSTLASGVFLTITAFLFNNSAMAGLPVAPSAPRLAAPDCDNSLTLLLIGVFALIGTKCVLQAIRKRGDDARQGLEH